MQSKSNWYEFGEKSSKYFLNLEKRNKAKSHVCKIITESNSEINEPQDILLHIKEFTRHCINAVALKVKRNALNTWKI